MPTATAQTLLEKATARGTALFWVLAASALCLYGSGEHDLFTWAWRKGDRPFLIAGLVCWAIVGLLFVYVQSLQVVFEEKKPLDSRPWAMQLGAGCFATAFVGFTVGLFPLYSILSPMVVVAITYGWVMLLSFLPNFGLMRSRGPLVTPLGTPTSASASPGANGGANAGFRQDPGSIRPHED